MLSDQSLKAARRPEKYLSGRWGIYSEDQKMWLDMVFASEREASENLRILLKGSSAPRRPIA
jgi:hypothetical protein